MSELHTNTDTDADKYILNGVEATPNEVIEIMTNFLNAQQSRVIRLKARIAELEEQVWDLNLANEKLESAYFADETIAPDGSLKPSVCKLMKRVEKAETDYSISEAHVTALLNRIAELEAAQRWIPVSERLPELYEKVIVFDEGGYMKVDFLCHMRGDFMYSDMKVTHWMPFPTPPEV